MIILCLSYLLILAIQWWPREKSKQRQSLFKKEQVDFISSEHVIFYLGFTLTVTLPPWSTSLLYNWRKQLNNTFLAKCFYFGREVKKIGTQSPDVRTSHFMSPKIKCNDQIEWKKVTETPVWKTTTPIMGDCN